jgi:hypothetical protein
MADSAFFSASTGLRSESPSVVRRRRRLRPQAEDGRRSRQGTAILLATGLRVQR